MATRAPLSTSLARPVRGGALTRLAAGGGAAAIRTARTLSRLPHRTGAAGVAGMGLVLLALLVWGLQGLPTARLATGLRAEWQSLEQQPVQMPKPRDGGSVNDFIARLPARSDLPAVLATIATQASAAGVELPRGTYQYTVPRQGGPARYEINLPVQGSYAAVRKFIGDSLAAVPAAALENIRLERKDVADADVHAELRFVVFVRSGT